MNGHRYDIFHQEIPGAPRRSTYIYMHIFTTSSLSHSVPPGSAAPTSERNPKRANEQWRKGEELQTSWIEIAFSCLFAGVKLEGVSHTPRAYAQQLLKIVNQIHKIDASIEIVPGSVTKKCKSNGNTHPIGRIEQCEIFFPDEPKKYLATKMLRGCDHHLNKWDFCL